MSKPRVKVAITGAAGQIGYAMLFRVAKGDMFGCETEVDLQLLELPGALPALRGVVMELEDCAFPLLRNVVATDNVFEVMRDVNWVISVGAVPRKAGMERSDLLQINGGIFTEQGRAINEQAASDVRVFVVGNPCNTNCLIAMHNAPDVPRERFYAMTLLDENRARSLLAQKANLGVGGVQNMIVWGNHSATQYPDFYHATLDGRSALDVIGDESWLQNNFISSVQKRGAEVIKARGASSAGSAANAAIGTVYRLIHDTPDDDSYSVSICSRGEYGVDEGLIFSFPSRTKEGKHQVITGIEHNAFAKEKIAITLNELREEKEAVKQLKLI
ncbi:MAG TPA: malate dehydrogenase [Gammaproteobacteria bacterium]|nr:malate dehydrogenase [Gammaproteobacteria bacterium]